jgi:hypothetical protein
MSLLTGHDPSRALFSRSTSRLRPSSRHAAAVRRHLLPSPSTAARRPCAAAARRPCAAAFLRPRPRPLASSHRHTRRCPQLVCALAAALSAPTAARAAVVCRTAPAVPASCIAPRAQPCASTACIATAPPPITTCAPPHQRALAPLRRRHCRVTASCCYL